MPSQKTISSINDASFHAAYRDIEEKMWAVAEADGDVFLPNPELQGRVQYILIRMESYLGRWARSADEARSKVEAGFRNFLRSTETAILRFCAQRYLCKPSECYHITDLSKGAMGGSVRMSRQLFQVGPLIALICVGSGFASVTQAQTMDELIGDYPFSLKDVESKCEVYRYSQSYGELECRGSELRPIERKCEAYFYSGSDAELECRGGEFRVLERRCSVWMYSEEYGELDC